MYVSLSFVYKFNQVMKVNKYDIYKLCWKDMPWFNMFILNENKQLLLDCFCLSL